MLPSYIVRLPLKAEHRERGLPIERYWEKTIFTGRQTFGRRESIPLPELGNFTVQWESSEIHRGEARRVLTLDTAPDGTFIEFPPEKMLRLGFELIER